MTDYKKIILSDANKDIILMWKKLKRGGTLIMFFDLWKITDLKNLLEKYNFKNDRESCK